MLPAKVILLQTSYSRVSMSLLSYAQKHTISAFHYWLNAVWVNCFRREEGLTPVRFLMKVVK